MVDMTPGIAYNQTLRGFQIYKRGFYFVYSDITFQSYTTSKENNNVHHSLIKRNSLLRNTNEEILMCNKYDGSEKSRGYYSSFLSGTILFQNGDELFVRVSNASLVYNYYLSNYFGLYEI